MGQAINEGSSYPALILPNVTTAQRNAITNRVDGGAVVPGSIVFNTNTNKFQGWTGSTWVDFH